MAVRPFPLQAEVPAGRRLAVNTGSCGQALSSLDLLAELRALAAGRYQVTGAGCDGACFQAPAVTLLDGTEIITRLAPVSDARQVLEQADAGTGVTESDFFSHQRRLLLNGIGGIDPFSLDSALAHGAYRGLWRALSGRLPDDVITEVEAAELRGRGGAYFPTGRKWRSARAYPGDHYVVVNAEEGEPAVYKDRHLIEGNPHLLLEGLLIAAYAVGASYGFIYVNGLAHGARRTLAVAVQQARERGIIGSNVLGSGVSFEVELRSGAGGYVLGEESVLLNSIEGQRSVPRTRPPFPVEAGLWASPTVINNVETLCTVPFIVREGAERFRQGAGPNGAGTKLVSLSGAVRRPGLVEVAMGTTIREVIFDIGGGAPEGRTITGVLSGGPSGGLLALQSLDIPARPGALHSSGAVLGSGGMVVLDESLPVVEVVRHLTAYNRGESCGKCTPCREGTDQMLSILEQAAARGSTPQQLERLLYLGEVATSASLCGLGQMAANPITSALDQFEHEFRAAFGGSSDAGQRADVSARGAGGSEWSRGAALRPHAEQDGDDRGT